MSTFEVCIVGSTSEDWRKAWAPAAEVPTVAATRTPDELIAWRWDHPAGGVVVIDVGTADGPVYAGWYSAFRRIGPGASVIIRIGGGVGFDPGGEPDVALSCTAPDARAIESLDALVRLALRQLHGVGAASPMIDGRLLAAGLDRAGAAVHFVDDRLILRFRTPYRPDDQAIGRPVHELFDGCDREVDALLRQALSSGRATEALLKEPGTDRWRRITACPEAGGVVLYSIDTTVEQRYEAATLDQQRLRCAVEAAELGTWRFDVDSGLYVGDSGLKRILRIPAEAGGMAFAEYLAWVHPADRAKVAQAWRTMLGDAGMLDLEYRVCRADGSLAWVRERGRLLRVGDVPRYAAGALLDVTERQTMKEALKVHEDRFQRIVMTANEGILEVDADFRMRFVNPRLAEMLGYTVDELIGRPSTQLIFDEDLPDHRAQMELRRRGTDSRYERRLRRKDDSACLTLVTTTAIRDESGAFIGSFGMFTELDKLKRLEGALLCREREFETLVENSPDIIFRLDRNGHPSYRNSAAARVGAALSDDGNDVVARICSAGLTAVRNVFDSGGERELHLDLGEHALRVRLVPERTAGGAVESVLGIAEDITEQRRVEYALRRTQALLEAGMRLAGFGIAEWDIGGGLIHVSNEWRQMHGIEVDRLSPREAEDLIHPADRTAVRRLLRRRPPATQEFECRIVRPDDGRVRQIRVTGAVFKDECDRPVRGFGIALDVTEARQREQLVRTQAYLLDNIAQGVNYVDENGVISYANPAFDAMFGYGRGELIGCHLSVVSQMSIDDALTQMRRVSEVLDGDGVYIGEFCGRRRDGSSFPAQVTVTRLSIAGRECSVYVLEDITERARAIEALRDSEQRLTTVLDKTNTGLWDYAPATGSTYFSATWYTMLGYTPDEWPATFESWERLVHPDDLPPVREAFFRLIESPATASPYEFCVRMRTRSGSWRWIDTRGVVVSRDIHGRATRIVGTHTDATERVLAEQALRDSEDRYRSVLVNLPGCVYRNEASFPRRAVVMTAAVDAVTGRSPQQFIGPGALVWRDIVLPADRPAYDRGIATALRRRSSFELEYRILHSDGHIRWVLDRGRAVDDGHGVATCVDGLVMDITERRLTEADRDRLARIIEATSDLVAIADANTQRIRYMNQAARRLCGLGSAEQVETTSIRDYHSELSYREISNIAIPTARRAGVWRGETVILTRSGEEIPISQVILCSKGTLDEGDLLFTIARDISELKQTEQALQAAHDQIKATFAAIPDLMFEIAEDGCLLACHVPDGETLYPNPEALPGRTIREIMPSDAAEVALQALSEAAASGAHRGATYRVDQAAGSRWFELSVARKAAGPGSPGSFVMLSRDITFRHQADMVLRESLERLRLALTAAQMDVFDFDPATDRVRRTVNRGARRWLPGEGTGRGYLSLVHPDDRRAFTAILRGLSPERPSYSFEYRARDPDGHYRWIADWAEARFDATGRVMRILGVAADVTDRKQAEMQLRALNEQLALAVSISRLGFYELDLATGRLDCNREFLEQLGYEPDGFELDFPSFESWLHPVDREMLLPLIRRHLAGSLPYLEAEYRVRHRNGEWVWIVDRSRIVSRHSDGTPERLVGVHLDVSSQKRSEEVLREKDERFQLWSEATDSIFWVAGPISGRSGPGPAMQVVARASAEDAQEWPWMDHVHPDDRKRLAAHWRAACETDDLFECESRIWHEANREYRWYLDRGIPRRGRDGEVLEWVGMGIDIQRQKHAEAALQEADRRKDEFLAMLGHELRNPLASIRSAGELLGSVTPTSGELQRVRDVILRQSEHLVRLVDDLLDVSRLLQGKIRLQNEIVDVGALVARVVEMNGAMFNARAQRLVVRGNDEPCFVQGDSVRLTQILENLLTNASKYSPAGGAIALETQVRADTVEFIVTDDGIGIRSDMLARVFSLFVQDERNLDRSPGGLGIGLTVARQLVDLHGGSIEAHSDGEGRGSCFRVQLPLFTGRAPAAQVRPAASERAPEQRVRVMIVDDNDDAAGTLASLLELRGHQVASAADGTSAIELADRFHPDVVLLDIGLPGMSGYQVARKLRAMDSTRGARIIAVTGYGQDRYRAEAEDAGFDLFLAKPVRFEQILKAMAES
ncbi:MAG: PAS domain-containing protein [Methylotetracoccus sp.]